MGRTKRNSLRNVWYDCERLCLPHLLDDALEPDGLLEELHACLQHSVPHDGVVGVARDEEDLEAIVRQFLSVVFPPFTYLSNQLIISVSVCMTDSRAE
jgi:hypothetical protein